VQIFSVAEIELLHVVRSEMTAAISTNFAMKRVASTVAMMMFTMASRFIPRASYTAAAKAAESAAFWTFSRYAMALPMPKMNQQRPIRSRVKKTPTIMITPRSSPTKLVAALVNGLVRACPRATGLCSGMGEVRVMRILHGETETSPPPHTRTARTLGRSRRPRGR